MANKYFCVGCGAKLVDTDNRSTVFCRYCGCKNVIESNILDSNQTIGQNTISSHTDAASIGRAIEFYVSQNNWDKVLENFTEFADVAEVDIDYCKVGAKVGLYLDANFADDYLMTLIPALKEIEEEVEEENRASLEKDIREIMNYTSDTGMTILHKAALYEDFEAVQYCVEHGADVNRQAGRQCYTPISIMFKPLDPKEDLDFDDNPLEHHRDKVKQIRRYLMNHGAIDYFRFGY